MNQVTIDTAEVRSESQSLPQPTNAAGHDPDTLWELYSRESFYRDIAARAIRERGTDITFAELPAILAEYTGATGAPSDSQGKGDDAR